MVAINICHHLTQGLHNDAVVLANVLSVHDITETTYSEIDLISGRHNNQVEPFDVVIFLEHIHKAYISCAPVRLFFPNIEWLNKIDVALMQHMTTICCKTHHAIEYLSDKASNLVYTGFSSITRSPIQDSAWEALECIHVMGVSKMKNTQLVVDTWLQEPQWPTLHVVYSAPIVIQDPIKVASNVVFHQRKLKDDELDALQQRCAIHVCPSACEGFGHYLNEGRSSGACIITTDAPPMNELVDNTSGVLVHCENSHYINRIQLHSPSVTALREAIESALKSGQILQKLGDQARLRYTSDTLAFEKNMLSMINGQ